MLSILASESLGLNLSQGIFSRHLYYFIEVVVGKFADFAKIKHKRY